MKNIYIYIPRSRPCVLLTPHFLSMQEIQGNSRKPATRLNSDLLLLLVLVRNYLKYSNNQRAKLELFRTTLC